MLKPFWNNVEIKLYERCFNVVSMSNTDVVSTLSNTENPMLDFVSFWTLDRRYFNGDLQRWNNVDPTEYHQLSWVKFSYSLLLKKKAEKTMYTQGLLSLQSITNVRT